MTTCKRALSLVALILGLLGVTSCSVAVISIWILETRVERATDKILVRIDDSLTVTQARIGKTQKRINGLKISTEEITKSLASWTKSAAQERLASQLGVAEKAQRIEAGLHQADQWLELTESSVQLVQIFLEMVIAFGAPLPNDLAEDSLEELASLRKEVAEAIEPLQRIKEHVGGEGLGEEQLHQIRDLSLRVIATITSVDSRLGRLEDRLTKLKQRTIELQVHALRWTRGAAISATVLAAWMAAGQGALWYFGWTGLRRGRLATVQRSTDSLNN
ncbi:hypothetical protein CA54_05610 [Symmachiella macrocystis]|uniref:Four helix bundle sensory module for signal transduction n=1 Tax=Symmachiella macrocystis TaxID=2527985 RepID=A0A5C6BJ65_9PLAN|nr:hypothetical protein [Symmachiella macrocystis]TWU11752.1 hypothetical protein CA54_05610 [Symmachiella macrocystis]